MPPNAPMRARSESPSVDLMHATLDWLPVDLIEIVADNLEVSDLISLHSSSRALADNTYRAFSKRCFKTVSTDLSYRSLCKLRDISDRESLRLSVQSILITRQDNSSLPWLHRNCPYREIVWRKGLSGFVEQKPSTSLDLLQLLRTKLVNVNSFRIVDNGVGYKEGHIISRCKPLEGLPRLSLLDGVTIALTLVAELEGAIQHFSLDTEVWHGMPALLRKSSTFRHRRDFQSSWSQIQDLQLKTHISGADYDCVLKLIRDAAALQRLSLRAIETWRHRSLDRSFLVRLKNYPLAFLRDLELDMMTITSQELLGLISSIQTTLERLRLARIRLKPQSTWLSIFKYLRVAIFPNLKEVGLRNLVEVIRNAPTWLDIDFTPLIRYVKDTYAGNVVSHASDAWIYRSRDKSIRLILPPQGEDLEQRVIGVQYNGKDTDLFLDVLVENTSSQLSTRDFMNTRDLMQDVSLWEEFGS